MIAIIRKSTALFIIVFILICAALILYFKFGHLLKIVETPAFTLKLVDSENTRVHYKIGWYYKIPATIAYVTTGADFIDIGESTNGIVNIDMKSLKNTLNREYLEGLVFIGNSSNGCRYEVDINKIKDRYVSQSYDEGGIFQQSEIISNEILVACARK